MAQLDALNQRTHARAMADPLPGKGFMGWLGRQVGHVSKAVKAKPTRAADAAPKAPDVARAPASPEVLYREGKVEEAEHPTRPGLKLRRTVIDEVIADPAARPTDADTSSGD